LDVDLSGGAAAALPPPILGATGGAWGGGRQQSIGGGARGGDAWSSPNSGISSPHDPWAPPQQGQLVDGDPWAPKRMNKPVDPWAPNGNGNGGGGNGDELEDEFDIISRRTVSETASTPFLMSPLTQTLDNSAGKKKNPLEFLGENSNLVNLDNLLPPTKSVSPIFGGGPGNQPNPFGGTSLLSAPAGGNGLQQGVQQQQVVNPFQTVIQKPSINEIREKQLQGMGPSPTTINSTASFGQSPQAQNNPWSPVKAENPFFN